MKLRTFITLGALTAFGVAHAHDISETLSDTKTDDVAKAGARWAGEAGEALVKRVHALDMARAGLQCLNGTAPCPGGQPSPFN